MNRINLRLSCIFTSLLFATLALACSGGERGDTGGASGGGGSIGPTGTGGTGGFAGAAGTGDMGGGFADVQAIFDLHCTLCHDAAKMGLPTYPALPLTSDASYDALVGKMAHEACGGTLVAPGHPDASYLFQKVSLDTPCEGFRMPRPFEIPRMIYLSDAELATLRTWIANGAQR